MKHVAKRHLEFIRTQARQRFDKVRTTWLDVGRWALPHRIKWMLSQTEGERNNQHIVDNTHTLALRSYVAGFSEGNTSPTRPWFRIGTDDTELNQFPANKEWLQKFTERCMKILNGSNFYHEAGAFYFDYGTFNTGAHYIDEINGSLFFHTLTPGSYYVLNNGKNVPIVLIREFSLTIKALVTEYGKKDDNGNWVWSNFTKGVRKMYEDSNYTQMVDVVHCVKENEDFNPSKPMAMLNKPWISYTYEVGGESTEFMAEGSFGAAGLNHDNDDDLYLNISASKRKPFIVGKSQTSNNFEYGEKGPTLDALGLIKSLNKKAIGKDMALEQMLKPALQGPANLKKSYITTQPNKFIPLDATALSGKGLRPVFEINPGIGSLIQDVDDLRKQVDKLYYADFLLFLSNNPKTRTATEASAIIQEQQLVIGPNLQSLNQTYNIPIVDFLMDFVLFEDPLLPPPPESLAGRTLNPEFISVFAQAQKAADLPSIDRYIAMIGAVAPLDPSILDKANLDKLADLYEDRLFLPAGLNNPQGKVDAMRRQAEEQARRQQQLTETLPAVASAAKDVGIKVNQ